MPSIKFSSTVLCEEVRREADGRAIIIGAGLIGPDLGNDQETEISRIAFYLEAEIVDVDSVWFRLTCFDNDDTPIEVDMDFRAMRNGGGRIVLLSYQLMGQLLLLHSYSTTSV